MLEMRFFYWEFRFFQYLAQAAIGEKEKYYNDISNEETNRPKVKNLETSFED